MDMDAQKARDDRLLSLAANARLDGAALRPMPRHDSQTKATHGVPCRARHEDVEFLDQCVWAGLVVYLGGGVYLIEVPS